MMTLIRTTQLASAVLGALACATVFGCSRAGDPAPPLQDSAVSEATGSRPAGNAVGAPYAVSETTASNTTIAADDTPKTLDTTGTIPPGAADEAAAPAADTKTTTTTTKKKTKHHSKKSKRAHKSAYQPTAPVLAPAPSVADRSSTSETVTTTTTTTTDVPAATETESTVSGSTQGALPVRETGLSPFFHEPNSRLPVQIGSGQMTGEDKSTTILEGPSLFQDPAALGRDLVR